MYMICDPKAELFNIQHNIYQLSKPRILLNTLPDNSEFDYNHFNEFITSRGYEIITNSPSIFNKDMIILIICKSFACLDESLIENNLFNSELYCTAYQKNIPMFLFVNRLIYAEYNIFKLNYDAIVNKNLQLQFPITKNLKLFEFIHELDKSEIIINSVETISDIENYLTSAWADIIKQYLTNSRRS